MPLTAYQTIEDIALLKETVEVECKLAAGRDGQGTLPVDFWPTYSAFCNTRGGVIILGVRERGETFEVAGIVNTAKVRREIFNELNNSKKVSVNLLSDDDVVEATIEGKKILIAEVPRATRHHKPVYINNNPMIGTYKRLNDGDRVCDAPSVKAMLAEQTEDSRDNRILTGFNIQDINDNSLRAYKLMLRSVKPGHPYLQQEDLEFLRLIGAYRRNRETNEAGLTVAGLLMFGKSESILEEFPNYFLDYQERDNAAPSSRWVDRVTVDGTWPGNLFEFYSIVYKKLTADLKVPFELLEGRRRDDTPVHEALREAFVNCIVHADHSGRASILVVKRPDMFGFRNPGLMRVPVEQALRGGESDGRNRTLQQMFLLAGIGERAGSGVPRIHKGWTEQHWRPPSLYQKESPSEQTLLELRMVDLLPPKAIEALRKLFGSAVDKLDAEQRLILATASIEKTVTHTRVNTICNKHPVDLTRTLQGLVHGGFLIQSGRTRGAVYYLPGEVPPSPDSVFSLSAEGVAEGADLGDKGADLSSAPLSGRSAPSGSSSEPMEHKGRLVDGLDRPLIDTLEGLHPPLLLRLQTTAKNIRAVSRVSPEDMLKAVSNVCDGHYLTLKVLAQLLGRDEGYLRQKVLNPMVDQNTLVRAFPQTPNDPRQAYTRPQR